MSVGLHVAALLALTLVVVTREPRQTPISIVASAADEAEPLETIEPVEIEPAEAAESVAFEPVSDAVPTDPAAFAPDPVDLADLAGAAGPIAPAAPAVDVFGDGFDAADLMAAIGGSGGDSEEATGATGGMPPVGGMFFGRKAAGRTALFMCDNSNSYSEGSFQAVLLELSRAVAVMRPEQSFHIVFFSDAAYPVFHPERIDSFLPATTENKQRLQAWLTSVELCLGGQGIREAAEIAIDLAPDVLYFLSDGEHAASIVDRMVTLPLADTVVHTFGLQAEIRDRRTGLPDPGRMAEQERRNLNLIRIAEAHGGTFTPVVVPPLRAPGARPVRKNRTRGPVWGINLPAAMAGD